MKSKFITCFLIILVLSSTFIHSDKLYNGIITSKQIWFFGTLSILFLFSGIEFLVTNRSISFNLNSIDIFVTIFTIYVFIRSVFTSYTPILNNSRAVNYILLFLFYFILRHSISSLSVFDTSNKSTSYYGFIRNIKISTSNILVLFLIIMALIQAIWGLLQLYGIVNNINPNFKITGTFFNPAPYAIFLSIIFPLAFGNLFTEHNSPAKNRERNTNNYILTKRLPYYVSLVTVFLILVILPVIVNRSSWLGIIASSIVVLNFRYNLLNTIKKYLINKTKKIIVISILAFVLTSSGIGLYLLKEGSSAGRLLIWEVTVGKIAEKPLFGHGVGRFESEYNNWQADYFRNHLENINSWQGIVAGNTKYCFNEYLEMASEIGIIGLILFILIIVPFFQIHLTEKRNQSIPSKNIYFITSLNQNLSIRVFSAIVSLLICAFLSIPFYSLPTLLIFYLLLAILSSRVKSIVSLKILKPNIINGIKYLIGLSMITVSTYLFIFTKDNYKTYNTWKIAELLYQNGSYSEACSTYSKIYSTLHFNGIYLQHFGKALSMNEKNQQSLEMLENATHFTSDDVLYTTLGDTYKSLNRFIEAEKAYIYASFMDPSKIYPKYQLAILYFETGQNQKALITAETILGKKVKIESNATNEIQKSLKELISKIKSQQ